MTTEHNTQLSFNSDRDYLELLIHKLNIMKYHGTNYYARKQDTDKRLFDAAKREVNEYMVLLKKRGYTGDRFANIVKPKQSNLF